MSSLEYSFYHTYIYTYIHKLQFCLPMPNLKYSFYQTYKTQIDGALCVNELPNMIPISAATCKYVLNAHDKYISTYSEFDDTLCVNELPISAFLLVLFSLAFVTTCN